MVNHSRAINRVFTRGVLLDLLYHQKSEVFDFYTFFIDQKGIFIIMDTGNER